MNPMTLRILDQATGVQVQQCTGPLPDGSCPRVALGDIVPCAGHAVVPALAAPGTQAHAVPGLATGCPVTLAAMIAIASDAAFVLDG